MSVVDDVKGRLDIVDVISGYVSLQKAGRNYKANCPFHNEKTPSFVVFPDTQTWRCFGACAEGGDVFGFVMKHEGWDFRETLQELAKRAGVELKPQSTGQVQRQAADDRLRALLEETSRFFHTQLMESPAGQIARDYVVDRGLTRESAEQFALGYAPDDWRQALQHLAMMGYSQDEIIEAGVATQNDRGNVYDRFRHRLVIPIRDERGRTVGFGARAFEKDAKPKYLNSPQGPLFDKSKLLYGLDLARRTIMEREVAVIVEGYMDVMQAHQAGFTNVIAQMGTALTEEQLRQLAKYARRLVLALDPDAAGMKATMRGLDVARETLGAEGDPTFDPRGMIRYTGKLNIDIRVVSLPAGQDPDDLIRETPQAWAALIERAVPVADYIIQQQTAHLTPDASYHEREQIARELLPLLTATESDLQRNGNIQALARRVRIDERTLIQWTQHQTAAQARPAFSLQEQRRMAEGKSAQRSGQRAGRVPATSQARRAVSGPPGQSVLRESLCLHLLLLEPERLFQVNRLLRELQNGDPALDEALAQMNAGDFTRPDYQLVFEAIKASLVVHDVEPLIFLERELPVELMAVVEELLVSSLESFQRALPAPLVTELYSVLRDQEKLNALREPDTAIFIEEALKLRQSRLERESRELYFVQQEADAAQAGAVEAQISAVARARQFIIKALQQFKTFSREA